MNLRSEVSLDQVDEWFQIGKQATAKAPAKTYSSIPSGKLKGRLLDKATRKAYIAEEPDFEQYYPAYKRQHSSQDGYSQYEEYIRQSQEQMEPGGNAEGAVGGVVSELDQLDLDSTVCGSLGMPHDLLPDGATALYDNYSFKPTYDPKLPITQRAEEVILTIESNQVTVIQGSTGSGKTTQVPQYILDHYAAKGEYCNIVVTQPRRIAAISIAKRVCQERGWPLGTVCGYQIGMDMKASEDTRLLYCTTGVLREKLIAKKNMHQYTHVILDEVHERGQDSDFALLVVKKLLRSNSRHVKVILMSATMNSDEFARYFSLPIKDVLEPAPVVNVEGQVFKVSQFFADDLSPLGQLPDFDETYPTLHPEIVDIAVKLIQEFDKLELKEQGKDEATGYATVRGTVLVFLPGLFEITFVMEKLKHIELQHHLNVIPLHSTITIDEQARVFEKPVRGHRKVILSTNIAESSITVPDIKYVIDFCLTKNLVCDPDTNYTHLQIEWASHSSCTQRKGRAGRVSQGRAYFMVTRDFYDRSLPSFCLPEMQRCPLETLVLKTKLLEMGEPIAILSQALAPPNLDNIERTILSLKQVGALCVTSNGKVKRFDGDLTFVGRVMAEMPVDIRIAKLMILGYVFGLLEECIIIGAALSLKSIFATPFQDKLEAFKHKYKWASGSLSDPQAILQAYRVWEKSKEMQAFRKSGRSEYHWGEKYYIQIRRINEVQLLVKELQQRLEKFNLVKVQPHVEHNTRVNVDEPGELTPKDSLFLKIVICGAFFPNYFLKKAVDEKAAMKILSNHDPLNTVMVRGLPQNQGVLYRDSVSALFSRCCSQGSKATVDVEESRGYIKFPRTSREAQHTVNPSVCFALKIRHLRLPLSVRAYDKTAAEDTLRQMQDAHELVTSQGFLRTNRVFEEDDDTNSAAAALRQAVPDVTQSVLEVYVSEVVHCGRFFAQCVDHQHGQHMTNLHTLLNPAAKLLKLSVQPYKNLLCAAPFTDIETLYYRALVEEFETQTIRNRSVRMVKVLFVDFGNQETVAVDQLRVLPSEAACIPLQAFECELIELRPSSVKCPDGNWTRETNTIFHNMVFGKRFLAQVYSIVRGVVRLELVHRQPDGLEVSINDQLISLKLADRVQEDYLSKQDHEWRLMESQASEGARGRNFQGTCVSTSLRLNIKKPPASAMHKGRRIQLTGPTNPLEMEFEGMTFAGSFRAVRTDPESVNSATVDPEPQNRAFRLMVAAFVGLNPDGNTIMARDTTIMPQIAGLPAIMCLLFSPVTELRVDRDRLSYTGALCGLGANPEERNLPLLPDKDVEVAFDVDISNEDIHLINRVRHAINLALGSRGTTAEWGPDAVAAKIQAPARQQLLQLLYKTREIKEPQYFNREYCWLQLGEDEVIREDGGFASDTLTLLPPIPYVPLADMDKDTNIAATSWQKQHIEHLHKVASTQMRGLVKCQLCHVEMATPQLLAVHLVTQRHLRREAQVLEADQH